LEVTAGKNRLLGQVFLQIPAILLSYGTKSCPKRSCLPN